jgi:glycosyltransferase involved in cell wall biosynthesis
MNVLMVTPHLPPHQAANALLPHLLGQALGRRGHEVAFLTFGPNGDDPRVRHVWRGPRALRATRLPQAMEAAQTWWKGRPLMARAEVVHVHSSTWMNQVAARLAVRTGKPYVLTHYGTEIWHHDGRDRRFRRFNREARLVTFYSRALLDRARELEVPLRASSVVYPPVADAFRPLPAAARAAARAALAPGASAVLLNVKRLHPLADQATLLRAFAEVRRVHPDAVLLVAGTGELGGELEAQVEALGLGPSVRFLGLVPNEQVAQLQAAADLFVLSSVLEATPTVALEALACGTPVVSTDNPGGVELGAMFAPDVTVVPKSDPAALGRAILDRLAVPARTGEATARRIAEGFRLEGVAECYLGLYREALRP